MGRLGTAVHVTAGFLDPGFAGQVTLEIVNLAPWAITLHEGMPIGQLAFFRMSSPVEAPYRGRYQEQDGPVESRYTLRGVPVTRIVVLELVATAAWLMVAICWLVSASSQAEQREAHVFWRRRR